MDNIAKLKNIVEKKVLEIADRQDTNAAWAGHHNTDSYHTKSNLEYWLDGIRFAQTGNTEKYSEIVDEHKKQQDPEYQQYLKLKEKFESK